jgi:hypothetical protein
MATKHQQVVKGERSKAKEKSAVIAAAEDKSRQVELIHRQNNNIIKELKAMHPQERELFLKKRGYVDQLAANFKELHVLGEYDKPLSTISLAIYNLCKENNVPISARWIQKILPAEFKDMTRAVYHGPRTGDEDDDVMEDENPDLFPEESFDVATQEDEIKPNPIWGRAEELLIHKPIDEMTSDELRNITERTILSEKQRREQLRETARRSEFLQQECETRKIALDPEIIKPKEPPISAVSQDSGPSLTYSSLKRYAAAIDRAAEKVHKYRPPPDLDKKFAAWIEAEIEVWAPYADEKFRKDIIAWFKIEADKCIMGKNASAKRNATKFSPEIQKLLKILKRDLTREQVGDNFLPMLELAAKVLETQEYRLAMHLWFLNIVDPEIAKRVVKMNPKLSALA